MAVHRFYLNVTLESMKDAVDKKFASGKKGMLGMEIGGKAKAAVAKALVTPEKAAPNMAKGMASEFPQKMAENGIKASASIKLVEGAFFVIEVQVHEVDLTSIISKLGAKSDALGGVLGCLLSVLSPEIKGKIERELLAAAIAKKMAGNMAEGIQEKTAEQGVQAVAVGLSPAEEGPFLLDKLSSLKRGRIAE